MKKRVSPHSVGVLLLDSRTGKKLWIVSVYLSTGVGDHEHHTQVQTCMEEWRDEREHVLLGADINVKIDWVAEGDASVPSGTSSKLHNVLNELSSKNMAVIPQTNPRANTFWTRENPQRCG